MTAKKGSVKQLITELSSLSGSAVHADDAVFDGSRYVAPEGTNAEQAIKHWQQVKMDTEQETVFNRVFRYRPFDGASATQRVFRRLFGGLSGVTRMTMFGSRPPQQVSINVGVNQTEMVPWGLISCPGIPDSQLNLGATMDPEVGPLFVIGVKCQKQYRAAVEGIFRCIEEELQTNSIYRGKAINGKDEPDFLDTNSVNGEQVVYSSETLLQLESNVWSLLKFTDATRSAGIPLKRAVLLEGPYGTGKSLGLMLTAQHAVRNSWTFVLVRPGRDDIHKCLQTAALYQPAVVAVEDLDTEASSDNVTLMLDAFDGITAKGTELLVVLTTNHVDRIHKAMKRPGRLDAIIPVGALDGEGITKLVRAVVQPGLLGTVDWEQVTREMAGFLPAFVREAVERAVRYAISRTGGKPHKLVTEDFVHAARGLRPQLDLMNESGEGKPAPTLDVALTSIVHEVVNNTKLVDLGNDMEIGVLQNGGKR